MFFISLTMYKKQQMILVLLAIAQIANHKQTLSVLHRVNFN